MNSSQTHRLCFFPPDGPDALSYREIPTYAADEIEELRAFVFFLYPPAGQDRFTLLRPDLLELRWVVWDKVNRQTFAAGDTARQAVQRAVQRQRDAVTPFSLESHD